MRQHTYKVPGDSVRGVDPNAFVKKLIEETGISHAWKRYSKNPENNSGLSYMTSRQRFSNQGPPDPERKAKLDVQELLWAVWTKCRPQLSRASSNHELHVAVVEWYFADFVIDNIDLAHEFVSKMHRGESRPPPVIMSELERGAQWGF